MDRDGTLMEDVGYPRDPADVRLLDGVGQALMGLRHAGFELVVVSNQSGIGRGIVTPEAALAVHSRFAALLRTEGVVLDAVQYCPHAPWDGCLCRKPRAGMLTAAAAKRSLRLEDSFMVGDRGSDVEAGHRAGCTTILLGSGGADGVDCVASDWDSVLEFIVTRES
jgi:D-glycero-D-manno-heptose 1,7-bisphosphate phosphatase